MAIEYQPRIVGFLCNWCSYAGADGAGTARKQYPANIRIIRVPCSGRVDPLFVVKCFEQGADGVLVAGCHPGDCHYTEGNYHSRRKLTLLHELLDYLGIDRRRFRLEWVSASEGKRFSELVTAFTNELREMGPQKPVEDKKREEALLTTAGKEA